MKISFEETFGPVAALIPFDDEDAVIQAANDTEYGLVAYAYTQDVTRVQTLPQRLEYGMVAINTAKGKKPAGGDGRAGKHGCQAW